MSQSMVSGSSGSWSGAPQTGGGLVLTVGALLGLAALGTACIAMWVFWVCATLLPAHDPAHIPMWRVIGACFVAFSLLSWTGVATGGRSRAVRASLGAVSLVAIGFGSWAVFRMVNALLTGGDVEGYVILMGMAVTGHGAIGLIYALLPRRHVPAPAPSAV